MPQVIGGLEQHLVQIACFLADPRQVDDQRRKDGRMAGHGRSQGLTGFDVRAHELERHLEHLVGGVFQDLVDGVHHGNPSAQLDAHVVQEFGQVHAFDPGHAVSGDLDDGRRQTVQAADVQDNAALAFQVPDGRGYVHERQISHAALGLSFIVQHFITEQGHVSSFGFFLVYSLRIDAPWQEDS